MFWSNNAGIERHGSVEELPLADVRAIMEPIISGPCAAFAGDARMRERQEWLHHQRDLGGRKDRVLADHRLFGIEVCSGSPERRLGG